MDTTTFFPVFCELLLKSAAVLALAGAVNVFWRGASAATQHMVWLLAVATLLVLPVTKLAAPRWAVELPEKSVRTVLPVASVSVKPAGASVAAVDDLPVRSWSLPPWRTMVLWVWLVGAGIVLGYRIIGSWRLRRLRRRSELITDERILSLAADCSHAQRAELRWSSDCRVPMAWGLRQSVVLLPEAALAWPQARLAAALRHEFGHVRRRDCLARLLAQVVCAVYWMNPLVWLAARRLRVAQEQACDDLVLRSGACAVDYADLLVDTVRGLGRQQLPALAMAQPSTLAVRVAAIVDDRRNRGPVGRGALLIGVAAVVALVAASALAQVQDKPDAQDPKAQIVVEAKIIELPADQVATVVAGETGKPVLFTPAETEILMQKLSTMKGVDILSAPRVVTFSGQKASIQIVRDFSFETADGKNQTVPVGVMLDVLPELRKKDNLIALDTALLVRELEESKPGKEPVFSERKLTTAVVVPPGQTTVLGGAVCEKTQKVVDKTPLLGDLPLVGNGFRSESQTTVKRALLLLVTAQSVNPGGAAKSKPVTVTSEALAYDKATGAVKASGNVVIETTEATITAGKAEIRPKTDVAQRAAKIIIPNVEFRDVPLSAVVEFFVAKGREFDPEKKGVNIVVQLPPGTQPPTITLSLQNIPLLDAMKYVAALSVLELVAEPQALRLQPKPVSK